MPEFLGFCAPAFPDADDDVSNLAPDLVERSLAFHDPPGIYVHVVGHPPIGLWIGANLHHGRDGGPDDRAAPGDEQDYMAAARDQFGDLGIVVDIGEAEADFAVRNHIEQVETAARRNVASAWPPYQIGTRPDSGRGLIPASSR